MYLYWQYLKNPWSISSSNVTSLLETTHNLLRYIMDCKPTNCCSVSWRVSENCSCKFILTLWSCFSNCSPTWAFRLSKSRRYFSTMLSGCDSSVCILESSIIVHLSVCTMASLTRSWLVYILLSTTWGLLVCISASTTCTVVSVNVIRSDYQMMVLYSRRITLHIVYTILAQM